MVISGEYKLRGEREGMNKSHKLGCYGVMCKQKGMDIQWI